MRLRARWWKAFRRHLYAFSMNRSALLWNPAAERMFGWPAAEVLGLEPPIIPEELQAEHNAVLERVRSGGQISFATRRACSDGKRPSYLRIDTSALTGRDSEMLGWVNVCHRIGAEEAAWYQTRSAPWTRRARWATWSGRHETRSVTWRRYWTGSRPACAS